MENFTGFSTARELRDALNVIEDHMLDLPLEIILNIDIEVVERFKPPADSKIKVFKIEDLPPDRVLGKTFASIDSEAHKEDDTLSETDVIEDGVRVTYVRLSMDRSIKVSIDLEEGKS